MASFHLPSHLPSDPGIGDSGHRAAFAHRPAIDGHRLIANGRCAALLRPDAAVDWWCAPRFDSTPLLWWLLDPTGGVSRWRGARMADRDERPAAPSTSTILRIDGLRLRCRDGLVAAGERGSCLVRLASAVDSPLTARHELRLGGLDGPAVDWRRSVGRRRAWPPGGVLRLTEVGLSGEVWLVAPGADLMVDARGTTLDLTFEARPGEWAGFMLSVDGPPPPSLEAAAELLDAAEAEAEEMVSRCRLPRHHPERARDALMVLEACTYRPTGAVVASPTTSLPEVPGGQAQWDYRYTWLRDASLAVSVAALLGRREAADSYLGFIRSIDDEDRLARPVSAVDGGAVAAERTVEAHGWAGSRPVRLGNAAGDQVQNDAAGMLVQAVSVYVQTGGRLSAPTWDLVRHAADHLADAPREPTNGIWELRHKRHLVDDDIGRWLGLDVALWLARLRRPLTRRRHWRQARDQARDRVLGAIGPDGSLPQAYGGGAEVDASALMVAVFALLGRRDPRAHALVDSTRRKLGAGPFLYRLPPEPGRQAEGAFLPVSWWVVTALAVLGRYDEARDLADDLCARLPRLLAEEVDPEDGTSLGNAALVWSHMELARALYVLDAARVRRYWGSLGLGVWRLVRYFRLRRLPRPREQSVA